MWCVCAIMIGKFRFAVAFKKFSACSCHKSRKYFGKSGGATTEAAAAVAHLHNKTACGMAIK